MTQKKLILFMPSVEGGGVEKIFNFKLFSKEREVFVNNEKDLNEIKV